jgi:hypothetical protein
MIIKDDRIIVEPPRQVALAVATRHQMPEPDWCALATRRGAGTPTSHFPYPIENWYFVNSQFLAKHLDRFRQNSLD